MKVHISGNTVVGIRVTDTTIIGLLLRIYDGKPSFDKPSFDRALAAAGGGMTYEYTPWDETTSDSVRSLTVTAGTESSTIEWQIAVEKVLHLWRWRVEGEETVDRGICPAEEIPVFDEDAVDLLSNGHAHYSGDVADLMSGGSDWFYQMLGADGNVVEDALRPYDIPGQQ